MTSATDNSPPEMTAVLKTLSESVTPWIPAAGDALAEHFPQVDPGERYLAMHVQLTSEWPGIQERLPLLKNLDFPALAAAKEGELPEVSLERCFTLMCLAIAMLSAFTAPRKQA